MGIFNGTVQYWNDSLLTAYNEALVNVNQTITVVVRADKSGTTQLFTSALAAFSDNWRSTYQVFSEGGTITLISTM